MQKKYFGVEEWKYGTQSNMGQHMEIWEIYAQWAAGHMDNWYRSPVIFYNLPNEYTKFKVNKKDDNLVFQ